MAEQLHSSFRCPLTLLTAQREKTSLIYGDQHVALDLRSLYIACVYMKWGRCLLAPKKMEAVQDPNSFFLFSSDPMAPCTTFDKDLKSALVSYVGPSAGFLTMTALRKSVITAVRTLQNRSPAVNSMLDKETLAWHQGHCHCGQQALCAHCVPGNVGLRELPAGGGPGAGRCCDPAPGGDAVSQPPGRHAGRQARPGGAARQYRLQTAATSTSPLLQYKWLSLGGSLMILIAFSQYTALTRHTCHHRTGTQLPKPSPLPPSPVAHSSGRASAWPPAGGPVAAGGGRLALPLAGGAQ